MSFQAMAWAVKKKVGNATGKAILLMLANYADDEGKCFPGQEKLASECECTSRTIREWLEKFEKMGLISREERRRVDGYRTSDLIVLNLEDTPKTAPEKSQGTHSPEGNSPEIDGNLTGNPRTSHRKEIPSILSVEPLVKHQQPRDAHAREENLDDVQKKLIDAAGEKIHPHGVFDLSAIIGLISAGVDLETDILPTIKARCATMKRPARGWAYFTDAIKDAHNRRIEAGKGLSKPKETVKPDSELSEEVLEAEWGKRLNYARRNRTWFTAVWGAMPSKEGCRVPEHLLQPNDGKHPHGGNWIEQ
ncbi:MAG TPA: helix-turn-helix domain-containing protein [Pseudomonadales bacterium]|nr:helix-turn-helix domain-containing protein [Pseudomonadales bacterium]